MNKAMRKAFAVVLSLAMVLTGIGWTGGKAYAEVDKPEIKYISIDGESTQPAAGGEFSWFVAGDMDADFEDAEVSGADFSMQVKAGDADWADTTDATAAFEMGTNYDEGTVTATVPDNTETVVKQWRFVYAGGGIECPPITQEAAPDLTGPWGEADFTFDGNTVTGLSANGAAKAAVNPAMVIPDQLGGQDVTAIGASAFKDAPITSVTYPAGLTSIGQLAFNGTKLAKAIIPDTVATIGGGAYANILTLSEIKLPDNEGFTAITGLFSRQVQADAKYDDLPMVEEVVIPDRVTTITLNSFAGLGLKKVTLPASLTTMGNTAFTNNRLEEVEVPEGVKKIGTGTFATSVGMWNDPVTIKKVTLHEGLTEIGKNAFMGAALQTVEIPSTVATLNVDAFNVNTSGIDDGKVLLKVSTEDQFNGTTKFKSVGSGHKVSVDVTFDANGGEAVDPATVQTGLGWKLASLPDTTNTEDYVVLDGWYTEAEGGEKVDTNTEFTKNTTIYAHWKNLLTEANDALDAAAAAAADAKTAADKAAASAAAAEAAAATPGQEAVDAAKTAEADAAAAAAAADAAKEAADAAKTAADAAVADAEARGLSEEEMKPATDAQAQAAEAVNTAAAAKENADKAYEASKEATREAKEAKADSDREAAEEAAKKAEQAWKEAQAAWEKAEAAKAEAMKTVTQVTVNAKTVNAKAIDKAIKAAGGSKKYVTKLVLGKKVRKIAKNTLKKYKIKTLYVKTKGLKKASVKGALKGSKVKNVYVKLGSKKLHKKYVKKYRKIFKKKNSGKKVNVK